MSGASQVALPFPIWKASSSDTSACARRVLGVTTVMPEERPAASRSRSAGFNLPRLSRHQLLDARDELVHRGALRDRRAAADLALQVPDVLRRHEPGQEQERNVAQLVIREKRG